jgi:hypothetical protein
MWHIFLPVQFIRDFQEVSDAFFKKIVTPVLENIRFLACFVNCEKRMPWMMSIFPCRECFSGGVAKGNGLLT